MFFDITDEALTGTDGTGHFGPISVTIPALATPGTHSISAEGRHSGLFAQAAFTVATNWAQYRDGPEHHGYNSTENLLSPSTVSGLDLGWSFTTGDNVVSSPAVANGVVYVGSDDDNLYALDAATGAKLWAFPTGSAVYSSSPAVANGAVYVGSNDHNAYAFGLATATK